MKPNLFNEQALKRYIKEVVDEKFERFEKDKERLWGHIGEIRERITLLNHKIKNLL